MLERRIGDKVKLHYSEKGGHKAKGDFQRLVRDVQRLPSRVLPVDVAWIARRSMLRTPRDGRI